MYINFFKYLLKLFHEWGREIKENGGGGEFKYDTFAILKDFCKCHNVPPTHHNNKK
jgi:hypothetical protein